MARRTASRNPVATEPVATQAAATVLVWLAARYGLHLSPEQATGAAGFVLVSVLPYARQLVRPTAKGCGDPDDDPPPRRRPAARHLVPVDRSVDRAA